MFSRDFLLQAATTYGLTPEQQEVFLQRLLENKSHQKIAGELEINVSACLRRMAEVYKKFDIKGKGRGKDSELRKFLIEQLKQYDVSAALNVELAERSDYLNDLNDRLSTIEKAASPEPEARLTNSFKIPADSRLNSNRDCLSELPCHNLPAQTNKFIGRKDELNRLLKCLSEDFVSPMITVDGIGGVGKTALVLEAAYHCLKARNIGKSIRTPKFDAIIFVSAKEGYLLSTGLVKLPGVQRTLRDIYRAISLTLNEPCINQLIGEEQFERVRQILSRQRTLLIVDNFETLERDEKDNILGFLKGLPGTVKSVITTREQMVIHVDIRLDDLSEEDSLLLIRQQTQEKALTLSHEEEKSLNTACGGVPLAIVYAIGRLANSLSLETVLEDLRSADSDLANFLFQKSINELKGQPAHKLLMSLAIFRKAPILNALAEVAELKTEPSSVVNSALERLQQLSLVRQEKERYGMLSLTREYALKELNTNLNFKQEAQERWFKWYLLFAQEYGGDDWGEWHKQYDLIDDEWENFLEVLDWCAEQNRFIDVKNLWQHLNKCANLYGYWDDRIKWLNWLIQTSQRHGDWTTFVEVTTALIWTLTLQESPENLAEADKLQQETWKLREYGSPRVQYVLAENIAVLRIRQGKYEEALDWFKEYKKLVTSADLDNLQKQRSEIRFLYYKAEILYREKKYDEGKSLYQKVVKQAEKIVWLRFVINAQYWLANIAIKQNDLDKAETLLKACLPVAERNHDKRRTALCQYSFARLEKARGNLEKASEWAKQALNSFERLGIIRDAEEICSFLAEEVQANVEH